LSTCAFIEFINIPILVVNLNFFHLCLPLLKLHCQFFSHFSSILSKIVFFVWICLKIVEVS